ncbi:MAG: uroporphyrinogen-III synthase [Burkholderiales bacterium]|nr:uroporphyrinogen-III synthase [Burkholderiales bacterium]
MSVHPLAHDVPPAGPLAGVGVLVTRPARQAAGLVAQLAALGARPVVFPAIVILPPADRAALDRAHAALDRYDVAIFVSANAVEYGVPAADRWPPTLRAFAPGPGTAAALAAAGVNNATIPATTFDSEGLLALPDFAQPAGTRVVIFRGDGGREHLGDTLKARGATVDYVACYRRAAPQSGAGGLVEALREGRLHALTLTSSEGLDNLCGLLDAESLRLLKTLPAFVPHPRIAARAQALGFAAIATGGADAGLVAGLLEWFASHPVSEP